MRGLPEFDLSGKVFVGNLHLRALYLSIVTGGARGLALVQVGALIEAGAAGVFAFDRLPSPEPKFEELKAKYPEQHLEYRQVDVTQHVSLKKHFEDVANWRGRLDGLVAAAGIQHEAPALDYTAEDCRRILDVNVHRLRTSTYNQGDGCVSLRSGSSRTDGPNEI
jgi:NAD(P)-dependent dehydrogenase (short-subunit alcohol dehydrogenase family)